MAAEGAGPMANGAGCKVASRPGEKEAESSLTNGTAEEGPLLGTGAGDWGQGRRGTLDSSFWLAACSVVGGCSCVGIYAVVNAVRASERKRRGDVESAQQCRRRAITFSALSFVTCVASVMLALGFIVLLSYLIRLAS